LAILCSLSFELLKALDLRSFVEMLGMAKTRFVKCNGIIVVIGLRVLPRLLRRELRRAFVSPQIQLEIQIRFVPVRIFCRGD